MDKTLSHNANDKAKKAYNKLIRLRTQVLISGLIRSFAMFKAQMSQSHIKKCCQINFTMLSYKNIFCIILIFSLLLSRLNFFEISRTTTQNTSFHTSKQPLRRISGRFL